MSKKRRLRDLEARIAALEVAAGWRDWGALPPAYELPIADLPTWDMPVPDFSLDDDGWKMSGYI